MEFEGKIIEKLETKTGTNQVTGNTWKYTRYVAQNTLPQTTTIVFDVWDGRDGRIERLNLQVGKWYRLFLSFEAKKNKEGKWFNSISAWSAREVSIIDENKNGEEQ